MTMQIKSRVRDYSVHYFSSLDETLAGFKDSSNVITVIDSRVHELYRSVIERNLSGPMLLIEATEENKSLERIGGFVERLLESGCRKNTQLLVIGGGILQDIGGFIASVLFRGIEWSLVPTTLLAQCDSCIGSKTSINISKYKNQLGTFYPPKDVLITNDVLSTLEWRDLSSGVCEALKLAMIDGAHAVKKMTAALDCELKPSNLVPVIQQALEIKKTFIEEDEFDKGRRNLLNYGHTFGHAFESASNYAIPHGIAVGLGMDAATFFAWKLGLLGKSDWLNVRQIMAPWCGAYRKELNAFAVGDLMKAMKSDKKSSNNQVGFILSEGFGRMKRQLIDFERTEVLLTGFLST